VNPDHASAALQAIIFIPVAIALAMIYAMAFIMAVCAVLFVVGVPICLVLWGVAELRFNPRWPSGKTVLRATFWIIALGIAFASPYLIHNRGWDALAALGLLLALFTYNQVVER